MHCQGEEEARADSAYIDVFEDLLAYARSKDPSLEVPVERIEYGDLLTTAKTIRRVMAHFAIATTWQNDLYDDALNRRRTYGNVFTGPDKSKHEIYYEAYGHEITPTEPSHLS